MLRSGVLFLGFGFIGTWTEDKLGLGLDNQVL
jgi:hypothetical protein